MYDDVFACCCCYFCMSGLMFDTVISTMTAMWRYWCCCFTHTHTYSHSNTYTPNVCMELDSLCETWTRHGDFALYFWMIEHITFFFLLCVQFLCISIIVFCFVPSLSISLSYVCLFVFFFLLNLLLIKLTQCDTHGHCYYFEYGTK